MKCCSTSSSATHSQDRGVLMNYLVPEIMLNIRFASRLVVDVRMNPLQWCIYIYIILNYRIGYHQVWESVFLLGWFDSLNCEKVRYPHCCNILCQYMRYGHFWGQIWKSGHTTIYRVSCSGNSVRFGGMMVIWALEHVHTWTSVGSCLTFYQLKARKPCCCPPVSGAGVGQVGWSSSCPPS